MENLQNHPHSDQNCSDEVIHSSQSTQDPDIEIIGVYRSTRRRDSEVIQALQSTQDPDIAIIQVSQSTQCPEIEINQVSRSTQCPEIEIIQVSQSTQYPDIENIQTSQSIQDPDIETMEALQSTQDPDIQIIETEGWGERQPEFRIVNPVEQTTQNTTKINIDVVITYENETLDVFLTDEAFRCENFWTFAKYGDDGCKYNENSSRCEPFPTQIIPNQSYSEIAFRFVGRLYIHPKFRIKNITFNLGNFNGIVDFHVPKVQNQYYIELDNCQNRRTIDSIFNNFEDSIRELYFDFSRFSRELRYDFAEILEISQVRTAKNLILDVYSMFTNLTLFMMENHRFRVKFGFISAFGLNYYFKKLLIQDYPNLENENRGFFIGCPNIYDQHHIICRGFHVTPILDVIDLRLFTYYSINSTVMIEAKYTTTGVEAKIVRRP